MSDFETNQGESSEKRIVNGEIENAAAESHLSDIDLHKSLVVVNNTTINLGDQKCSDTLTKIPMSSNRNRKNVSPTSCVFNEVFIDPQSPSASSTTSQATSANDATFEPTIEMMVNDFDDEQTLNEEEALASLESQDPDEEINTLKKESDMPLEELLAKYRALPNLSPPNIYSEPVRKKQKKSSSHKVKQKQKHHQDILSVQNSNRNEENIVYNKISDNSKHAKANSEYFDEEIVSGKHFVDDKKVDCFEEKSSGCVLSQRKPLQQSVEGEQKRTDNNVVIQNDIPKARRSHLMDLYPEGMFGGVAVGNETIAGNSKEIFYGAGDEEDYEENEEEDDDFKKKVMIGTSYQATIPIGLSQYGDVLPYENEDKLIWEPCQVSEREVEEYLIKIRDIKSNQQSGHHENSTVETNSENSSKENGRSDKNVDNLENNSFLANGDTLHVETTTTMEADNQAVVKDNEQALHLLVQCGYDFKEALRRKRLNALPLNDCMSLWSEEECHKFEEGIQKYGKDFLKIRQNQVRTRTMRELVQFYYLWKKSERRDHNFANADTVDHMDIYLNEDNDYGSTPSSVVTPLGSPVGNNSNTTTNGRNIISSQKNISIMTTTSTTLATTNINTEKNGSSTCLQQHHKRRTNSCNQSNPSVTTNEFNGDNSSKILTNNPK